MATLGSSNTHFFLFFFASHLPQTSGFSRPNKFSLQTFGKHKHHFRSLTPLGLVSCVTIMIFCILWGGRTTAGSNALRAFLVSFCWPSLGLAESLQTRTYLVFYYFKQLSKKQEGTYCKNGSTLLSWPIQSKHQTILNLCHLQQKPIFPRNC